MTESTTYSFKLKARIKLTVVPGCLVLTVTQADRELIAWFQPAKGDCDRYSAVVTLTLRVPVSVPPGAPT
jgi:hypothetical protein